MDPAAREARVTYAVTLGPACTFGSVALDGTGAFPRERVLEVISIKAGEPYSQARIDEAIAALVRLGIFASVEGSAQLSPPGEPQRTVLPAVFHVTPATSQNYGLGGGAEAGARVEAHLVGSYEHHNVFGQLGRLSLEGKVGGVVYPWSLESLSLPAQGLLEVRGRADLVQPVSLRSQTNLLGGVAGSVYELLPGDLLGYYEVVGKVGVERDLWESRVHLGLLGNVQYDQPFLYPDYGSPLSASSGYGSVTIPFVRFVASLNLRTNEERNPIR